MFECFWNPRPSIQMYERIVELILLQKRGSETKGFMKGFMSDSTPSVSSQTFVKIADGNQVLEDKRIHMENLERQLKSLHKALETVVKQRLGACAVLNLT